MPARAETAKSRSIVALVVGGAVAVAVLLLALFLLVRPRQNAGQVAAPAEATAYLSNLALSDVTMKASENFMNQQVVEVDGKLTNNGPRSLKSVEVYCLFSGIDGREIHRERVPVISIKSSPVRSGETRAFRLPFDALPEGWNQAMPKLVIASITFSG